MQVVHQRCCGLDVHKKTVVACVLIMIASGEVQKHIRTFSTMTVDLIALADWLKVLQVTHVAMESTGVFWKPVFNLLEADFSVILINAQHMKAVPGRKTDIKDSEWIADLLRHGLLKASFIPPQPIRVLRELTRYRNSLVQERAQEVNRLQKTLEGANIKLAAVATDVLGKSGRDMIQALIGGVTDPEMLAELARGLLRKKLPALQQALFGRVQPHHQTLLRHILAHIDFLETQLSQLLAEIESQIVPYTKERELLTSISGIFGDDCGDHSFRNWGRYVSFPFCQAFSFLGRRLPRQSSKWREALERSNHWGESISALCAYSGCLGRFSYQE